ncbi:MAG: methyltransferase [Pseudomonadota bacterium]
MITEPECQPAAFDQAELTEDAFLNGRLKLLQPKRGYRAATDPVFLAAACPAQSGDTVLDVGSGVGAASFCLAARVRGAQVSGLELQAAYAELSERNASRNGVDWRVWVGNVASPPAELRSLSFDHVITNPPFHSSAEAVGSSIDAKDAANRETVSLEAWLDCCLRRLKPKGSLTIIHRVERVPQILSALKDRTGDTRLHPLWPRAGKPAKRVVIRSIKDARAPFRVGVGLVLHDGVHDQDGDDFSDAAQAILRNGAALEL